MSQSGNKITRAMILAAGLGTRLEPLTHKTPKPLLPVKGVPLIDYNLRLIKKAGVKDVVINLHHLGEQIKKYIGNGRRYGLKAHYLFEPAILGTGGGIKNAERFFKKGPFFVINADVLINVDLKKVAAFHLKNGGSATMVVKKLKRGERYTRLDVKNGRLKGFGKGQFSFTGVQVLDPIVFQFLKRPSCLIESGYKKMLKKKITVAAYLYKGYWNDVGTLSRYCGANSARTLFKGT